MLRALRALLPRSWYGLAVCLLVLLPAAVATPAATLLLIDPMESAALRVLSVAALSAILLVATSLWRGMVEIPDWLRGRIDFGALVAVLLTGIPLLSVLMNGLLGWGAAGRVLLWCVFVWNLFILFPLTLARRNARTFVDSLSTGFLLYALALAAVAVALDLVGLNPSPRLGFPLTGGGFGYVMLIGYLLTSSIKPNRLLSLLFAALAVLSGSRAIVGLLVVLFGLGVIRRGIRGIPRLVFVAALAVVIGFIASRDETRVASFTRERTDVTSGRSSIWSQSIERLDGRSTALGFGEPQRIEIIGTRLQTVELGTHNAHLDSTLTYGIFFALLSVAVWIFFFAPRRLRKRHILSAEDPDWLLAFHYLQWDLFLAVSARSLVTNTFWTNMGDAATLFAVFLLLMPVRHVFIQRNTSRSPERSPRPLPSSRHLSLPLSADPS